MYYDLHRYLCLIAQVQSQLKVKNKALDVLAVKVGLCKGLMGVGGTTVVYVDIGKKNGHTGSRGVSSIMNRLEFLMTNPDALNIIPFCNSLEDMDYGIIFPGQCQSKGKKEKKCFHVQLKYEGWDREGGREGDARGKRYGNICICITASLCYKAETNTPL